MIVQVWWGFVTIYLSLYCGIQASPIAAEEAFLGPRIRLPGKDDVKGPALKRKGNEQGAVITSSVPSSFNYQATDGLTAYDSRTRDGGNSWSLIPPDGALCVGNGFMLEAINAAVVIRNSETLEALTEPQSLNTFFGVGNVAYNRTSGEIGDNIGDPVCVYDEDTKRFFFSVYDQEKNNSNWNHVNVAVSTNEDPTLGFQTFQFLRQDVAFLDFPHLGLNEHGLFITFNNFPFGASEEEEEDGKNEGRRRKLDLSTDFYSFIIAVSKRKLAAAASAAGAGEPFSTPDSVVFDLAPYLQHSVSPAMNVRSKKNNKNQERYSSALNGVQYFIGHGSDSNAEDDYYWNIDAHEINVFALTNTASLDDITPDVKLSITSVESGIEFVNPDEYDFIQRPSQFVGSYRVDSLDGRINDAKFFDNKIHAVCSTAMADFGEGAIDDQPIVAIAYMFIEPHWDDGVLSASLEMEDEGVIALAGSSLLMPSIAVSQSGVKVIGTSVMGLNYYPTAAFVVLDEKAEQQTIHITARGKAALYEWLGDEKYRFGDYSAACTDGNDVYLYNEFVSVDKYPIGSSNHAMRITKLTIEDDNRHGREHHGLLSTVFFSSSGDSLNSGAVVSITMVSAFVAVVLGVLGWRVASKRFEGQSWMDVSSAHNLL